MPSERLVSECSKESLGIDEFAQVIKGLCITDPEADGFFRDRLASGDY